MKRELTEWEKLFANDMTGKYIKNSYNSKKTKNPIKK